MSMDTTEKKPGLLGESTGQQSFLFTQGMANLFPPLLTAPGLMPDLYHSSLGPMPGSLGALGGAGYTPQNTLEYHNSSWFVSSWNVIPGAPALLPFSYLTYRRLLADPTIAMAFAVRLTPVMAGEWSYEGDDNAPPDAVEYIRKMLEPLRMDILQDAVRQVTMGWVGAEKLFEVKNGMLWLNGLKPLLHEITRIDIDQSTGRFAGFNNMGAVLPLSKCVLWTYNGEAGNHYGRSECENLRMVQANWMDANDGASRYDRKIAGVFMVMHYPPGRSLGPDNKEKPNAEIAKAALDAVVSGKPIAMPNEFAGLPGEPGSPWKINGDSGKPDMTRWRLELLEDKGGRQPTFIQRLEYLDKLKFRGVLIPERAASEATSGGSRADSETHQNLVLTLAELLHKRICAVLNQQVVNQILRINWGPAAVDTVRIVPIPIVDEVREYYQELVKAAFAKDDRLLKLLADFPEWMERAGLSHAEDADEQMELIRDRAQQAPEEQPQDGMMVRRVDPNDPASKAMLSLIAGNLDKMN